MNNQEVVEKIIGRILAVRKYQNKTTTIDELKQFFVNLITPELLEETLNQNLDLFKVEAEKLSLVKSFASTSMGRVL